MGLERPGNSPIDEEKEGTKRLSTFGLGFQEDLNSFKESLNELRKSDKLGESDLKNAKGMLQRGKAILNNLDGLTDDNFDRSTALGLMEEMRWETNRLKLLVEGKT